MPMIASNALRPYSTAGSTRLEPEGMSFSFSVEGDEDVVLDPRGLPGFLTELMLVTEGRR